MAEAFDFGLQQHKIKMDGKFFENNLFAVAGDTGRRLEVQLLDSNNMVQNTAGISLRLNADVAGQATYAEATLVDATKGLYELDLPNGMLIAPGNWQFQWQIIGANGEKLHSFAFMGTIGSNLAEGAAEGLNFYLNLEELKQMQEDLVNGTFNSEVLETNIAEKLNNLEEQYAPKLTEVTAQLAQTEKRLDDNEISPNDFEGSDAEKLQQAINQALSTNGAIRLSKIYDMTNSPPLMLDKVEGGNREPLYFIGAGGGIKKDDSGFIFSAEKADTGDFFYNNVKFYSKSGARTVVFDTDKLIRVFCTDCAFRGVDTIANTTRYIQSFYLNGGSSVGGSGWLFEAPAVFDFAVSGGFFAEQRDSFFKQTTNGETSFNRIYGARFRDFMVEGLTGLAFEFVNTESLVIDGGYFESNKEGHIKFVENAIITGVEINNNRVSENADTNLTHFIQWGGVIESAKTSNNTVRRIATHQTDAVKSGKVTSVNDRATKPENGYSIIDNIDSKSVIADLSYSQRSTEDTMEFSEFKIMSKDVSLTQIAGHTTTSVLYFPDTITRDSIISVQIYGNNNPGKIDKITVDHYFRNPNVQSQLYVQTTNNGLEDAPIRLFVTILKPWYSIRG